jgi:hypothetical protein
LETNIDRNKLIGTLFYFNRDKDQIGAVFLILCTACIVMVSIESVSTLVPNIISIYRANWTIRTNRPSFCVTITMRFVYCHKIWSGIRAGLTDVFIFHNFFIVTVSSWSKLAKSWTFVRLAWPFQWLFHTKIYSPMSFLKTINRYKYWTFGITKQIRILKRPCGWRPRSR